MGTVDINRPARLHVKNTAEQTYKENPLFDKLISKTKSFKMSERKAVVKNADMSEEMQTDAIECATQAMEKFNIEKDIAAYIKKEFDKKYNPTWHCIVGRNFGS